MHKFLTIAGVMLVGLILSGCTRAICISPSSVPITANDTYTKLGHASGDSTTVVVMGIPFGPSNPSRVARDEAIAEKKGNGLIEVTQDFTIVNLFIVQFDSTTVEGTVIDFQRNGMEIK